MHTSPASLRIGVYDSPGSGHSRQAAMLALLLRDYGGHRVLGYCLVPPQPDPTRGGDETALTRWLAEPVANAPSQEAFIRHVDLVYLFQPEFVPRLRLTSARTGDHPVLVLARTMHPHYIQRSIRWIRGQCPIAYNPVPAADTLDEMASPPDIQIMAFRTEAAAAIEMVWRPIINTVPYYWAESLSGVSETGLVLPPEPSEVALGVSTPSAAPGQEKGHEDAAGR